MKCNEAIYGPIETIIRKLGLHHQIVNNPAPVDIRPLVQDYDLASQDLPLDIIAWSFLGRQLKVIRYNVNYPPMVQKIGILHEISHHLLEHPGRISLAMSCAWLIDRLERQADIGAALLAVPAHTATRLLKKGYTMRETADVFEVPECIVRFAVMPHAGSVQCSSTGSCSHALCNRYR